MIFSDTPWVFTQSSVLPSMGFREVVLVELNGFLTVVWNSLGLDTELRGSSHGVPCGGHGAPWFLSRCSMRWTWSSVMMSMEFRGVVHRFREVVWNSMSWHGVPYFFPWSSVMLPMEFHGVGYGTPWGWAWSSMQRYGVPYRCMEFHAYLYGTPWKYTEFHVKHHGKFSAG